MEVLIVGAGIAGLTLAALLKKRGLKPVIIEKRDALSEAGYMIGLYPIGANVLRQLDLFETYLEVSNPCEQYEAYNDKGTLLKRFSFTPITEHYGPYQLIARYDLLKLLYYACDDLNILFKTQATSIQQNDSGKVEVVLSDKSCHQFDLVIGADGLHSQIRNLILPVTKYHYFNTNWGGWVWWCDKNVMPLHTIQEFWGTGTFFGAYPLKEKVGVVAAVDHSSEESILKNNMRSEYIDKKFLPLLEHHPEFFNTLPHDQEKVFFWPLVDQRAEVWAKNRVVLVGDSAAGFLPTAGIGATMALESASVLDDILSRTGKDYIPQALQLFEKRRRLRVLAAQNNSRRLAKLMFISNPLLAWLRNSYTHFMSTQTLVNSIIKGFDEPI